MSLELTVYTNKLSDDLIPVIISMLNQHEMTVEIYPDFSFATSSGFLPFKFQLYNSHFDVLKDKILKSGFELYVDDFNLQLEKENLKPKPGFLDKLFGKKQEEVPFASPEIERRLKDCTKAVSFIWHAADSFELRFASLTSAILAKLTDGVCCYTDDNIWYNNENIIDEAYEEVKRYEQTINSRNLTFHEFDEW